MSDEHVIDIQMETKESMNESANESVNDSMNESMNKEPIDEIIGLDIDDCRYLSLKDKDGKIYQIKYRYAIISQLIKTSLENDSNETEIYLPLVNSGPMEIIIEYLSLVKGEDFPYEKVHIPLKSNKLSECIDNNPIAEFINRVARDRMLLYELISAANYLDIKGLLHLLCMKIATLSKGKNISAFRIALDPNIVHDD